MKWSAQLGVRPFGYDRIETAVSVATLHAKETGIAVTTRCYGIEALAEAGDELDVVLAMEAVEHLTDSGVFQDKFVDVVSLRGLIILSTIDRTLNSCAFAIAMSECVSS